MGKKKNKNKTKKVNPKKEKYAKFHKEKDTTVDLTPPDLTDEQQQNKQEDEKKIDRFVRFNRNPPTKEVVARKAKSKR